MICFFLIRIDWRCGSILIPLWSPQIWTAIQLWVLQIWFYNRIRISSLLFIRRIGSDGSETSRRCWSIATRRDWTRLLESGQPCLTPTVTKNRRRIINGIAFQLGLPLNFQNSLTCWSPYVWTCGRISICTFI